MLAARCDSAMGPPTGCCRTSWIRPCRRPTTWASAAATSGWPSDKIGHKQAGEFPAILKEEALRN